jgi:hypothetical protein
VIFSDEKDTTTRYFEMPILVLDLEDLRLGNLGRAGRFMRRAQKPNVVNSADWVVRHRAFSCPDCRHHGGDWSPT